MLGVKIAARGSHSNKTPVKTAVQGFKITLLSSKRIGYHRDLNEKPLVIIRTRDFDV